MHVSLISDTSVKDLTQGKDYTVNDRQVTLAAPTDLKIKIYRVTTTKPLVGWADASVLRAADMTVQSTQLLHLAEETSDLAQDGGLAKDTTDNIWDARYNKIKNLLDPTDPGDAVTLRYITQNEDDLINQLNATGDNQNTRLISTGNTQNASLVHTGNTQNSRLNSTGDTQNARLNDTGDLQNTRLTATGNNYVSTMTSLKDTTTLKATEANNSADLAKKWAVSETSPDGAEASKSSKTWAGAAKVYATNAVSAASASASSATASQNSATTSASSASVSSQKATDAANSASNAKISETNAFNSAKAAKQSEENARQSASNAASSASASASSATASQNSATNSASSASVSSQKATDAANSAALAKKWAVADMSPDGATNSKSSKTWAEDARQSASNSASSATASASSATTATQKATAAASSASAASTSASNAATSATNAKDSETNAASSASAAAASADRAATFDPTNYYKKSETYTKTEVDNKIPTIDLSLYALKTDLPTKTSQLTNDSNFVNHSQRADNKPKFDGTEFLGISKDGVVEAGQYIDMHEKGSNADYAVRLDCTGGSFNIITKTGHLVINGSELWIK